MTRTIITVRAHGLDFRAILKADETWEEAADRAARKIKGVQRVMWRVDCYEDTTPRRYHYEGTLLGTAQRRHGGSPVLGRCSTIVSGRIKDRLPVIDDAAVLGWAE